jgi:DNA-binding NtrC family response regulator
LIGTQQQQQASTHGHGRIDGTVLIVEDQPAVAKALLLLFDIHGIDAIAVSNPADAEEVIRRGDADAVVQDMNFTPGATGGEQGLALFRTVRAIDPGMPVILLTAWTALETAVQMVKEGAIDYLAKPWSDDKLLAIVGNALTERRGERDVRRSRSALAASVDLCGVVYESTAMHRIVTLALQVAGADVPVLITGPNGTGKEKIADLIQANSRRRKAPFIKVNAGALPDELLESELFGAEAGAFTGSKRLRIGRFETANGGTLFLDEIGNLSSAGQTKLLRVLQNGEFERLGSSDTRRVDVRLLCATNADLGLGVRSGAFREDLFFRLNVIEIHVPPLRERREDVLPIAESFLVAARKSSSRGLRLSADARDALVAYDWPGNIRELQNRIQRATVTAAGDILSAADLGLSTDRPPAAAPVHGEKEQIENVLRDAGGNVSDAAKAVGVSRQALYRKMQRLGIVLERGVRSKV